MIAFVIARLRAVASPPESEREEFVVMPASATAGLDLDPRSELDGGHVGDDGPPGRGQPGPAQ